MGQDRALYRGLGSIAFTAACRLGWFIADPRLPRRFVLAQLKNNLDPPQPSLAYTIATGPAGAAQIHWLGLCTWAPDDLLAAAASRARDRAAAFLADFLKNGPPPARDLARAARPHALFRRTLQRAARDLEIRFHRTGAGLHHTDYWLLPGQELPAHLSKETAQLDQIFRRLEEQFPRRDPLEGMGRAG